MSFLYGAQNCHNETALFQWLQALENRQEDGTDNNFYTDDFNDGDEMDLVTRYGLELEGISEDDLEQEDVEDIIERSYSAARPQSQTGFRNDDR